MSELHPDSDLYTLALAEAVRRAHDLGGHAPTEDPLERMRWRVREASNRLTAFFMTRGGGPLDDQEVRPLAEHALAVGAACIRGLDDCLNAGVLSGYVDVTEERVGSLVDQLGGAPAADPDEISDIDPAVEGWLGAVNIHVAPVMLAGTNRDVVVREAFAAIGASAAMAADLMRRSSL